MQGVWPLTGGPVGLMSSAKLVRWKHWHTVMLREVLRTLQPSVSHDTSEPLHKRSEIKYSTL